MEELFKQFLKENKIFKKYYKRVNGIKYEYTIRTPEYLISSTFEWSSTIEGFTFWASLSHKWRVYYNENKNVFNIVVHNGKFL